MKKKRILHVISSVSAGGIESLVVALLANIDELAVFNPNQPIHQPRLEELGALVHFISTAGSDDSFKSKIMWRFKAVWNYAILIFRNQYDVVHCHNFNSFGAYIILAAIRGVPIRIVHSHNAGSTREKRIHTLARRVKNLVSFEWLITDKIGCSQMANDWLYGKHSNSKVIYNGIDTGSFTLRDADKAGARQNQGLPEGVHFVNVGRFNTQKNQHFLIETFHEMAKKRSDFYLTMVGFGPSESSLRDLVVKLGLKERVMFLPFDTDIPELMAVMDFFLLPSLWEGLPITAIESQYAGIPIFISDTVTREVDMGLAVYLPLHRSAKYWAANIVKSIEEKSYPKKIDRERAKSFDIKNIAKQFESLYGQVDE
jgi:glycosyltransferase involved in cell wall biosynthesis